VEAGLWKWENDKRQGDERATVIAEKAEESYKNLTTFVGLDFADINKWLEKMKPNTEVKCGDKFTVPNMVYVNDLTGIPAWNY
jgi:hypothetical protein